MPANSIFSSPILITITSTLNAMCIDENPFTCQCEKEDKRAERFQILHYYGSFLKDMAVKRLINNLVLAGGKKKKGNNFKIQNKNGNNFPLCFQSYRAPPKEPKRVCYYNFEEIQKDIDKVQAPWCVTQNTSSCIQLAVISQNYVKLGVSLHSETDMQAFITVYGMKAAHLTTNLESKKLVKFLRELQEMTACAGVTATHLQDYASLPDGTKKYFRHVLYHFSDGPRCHTSCVRSASCRLLLATSDSPTAVCKDCCQVERMLSARHHGRSSRALGTIKTNDPLFGVPTPQLKEAFKKARYSQRQAEKQLEALKEKLKHLQPQGGDQVCNSLEATDTPSVETQKNLKAADTPPLETQNSVISANTPSAEMQNNLKATDTPSVEMQALNTPSVEFLQMKAFYIASVEINSSDIPSVEMHSDIKPFDNPSVEMHGDIKPFDTPSLEIHSDIKPFDTL